MNEKNELEQKNLKNKIIKKHSLQEKTKTHKYNKNFPILQKTKITKAFSTKHVSNFVPTLRPKESFCKPTFMQLNQNQPKLEIENEDSDFSIISSSEGIDEIDSNSNQSSFLTSSNDEIDKEEEKLPDKIVDKGEDKIINEIPENKIFNEDKSNSKLTNNDNNYNNTNDAQTNENKVNKNLTQNIITSIKRPLSIIDVLKNKNKKI
jgi:hypothetical protein